MIVKAIYKDETYNYFKDKTTSEQIENQVKRVYGDIFECDDELAQERIKGGFVVEVSEEEQKQYVASSETTKEDKTTAMKQNENSIIIDTQLANVENSINLDELSYKDLQDLAKSKKLKYTGVSKENLIKSLKELENGDK